MRRKTKTYVPSPQNVPKEEPFQSDYESILRVAHAEEINRKDAEEWPRGTEEGPTFWTTWTNKGILTSRINPKTKRVSHKWNTRGFPRGG